MARITGLCVLLIMAGAMSVALLPASSAGTTLLSLSIAIALATIAFPAFLIAILVFHLFWQERTGTGEESY